MDGGWLCSTSPLDTTHLLYANARTQRLAELFGTRGRKCPELLRVMQSFSDPTAYVGRRDLTAALAQREAALAVYGLAGKRGKDAEARLYRAHADAYLAEKAEREGSLRRSSRTSTRASTAATAGSGSGGHSGLGLMALLGGREAEARVSACVRAWVDCRGRAVVCGCVRRTDRRDVPSFTPLRQLLFKFPLEEDGMDRVTLTTLDQERLEPGEFLNDNVIDFHFKCVAPFTRIISRSAARGAYTGADP